MVVVLPSPSGVGRDRRDHDVLGDGPIGELVDGVEADLGELATVGLEQVLPDPHHAGDLRQRLRSGLTCDLEIGWERHERAPPEAAMSPHVQRCRGGFCHSEGCSTIRNRSACRNSSYVVGSLACSGTYGRDSSSASRWHFEMCPGSSSIVTGSTTSHRPLTNRWQRVWNTQPGGRVGRAGDLARSGIRCMSRRRHWARPTAAPRCTDGWGRRRSARWCRAP